MIVSNLRLQNFRNLADGEVAFLPSFNILIGNNGQGKSSLLEAIYLLGCTKSFRTSQINEVVRHGTEQAWVSGTVWSRGLHKELAVGLFPAGKRYLVNQRQESLFNYLGGLIVLAITGDQISIVTGYPEERRRFLNRIITGLQPTYLSNLLSYQRALRQKNALLRAMKEGNLSGDPPLVEAFNAELIDYGASIVQARDRFARELKARLTSHPFGQYLIKAKYLSMPSVDLSKGGMDTYRAAFTARLADKIAEEMAFGYARVGPHRDDLLLFINGKSAQKFASSGEKRSLLMALHLACLEIYHQTLGEYPPVMIDDIDAELDPLHIDTLLNHLTDKCQLFISTAKTYLVRKFLDHGQTLELVAGQVRPGSSRPAT